jgi:hypothetical protein
MKEMIVLNLRWLFMQLMQGWWRDPHMEPLVVGAMEIVARHIGVNDDDCTDLWVEYERFFDEYISEYVIPTLDEAQVARYEKHLQHVIEETMFVLLDTLGVRRLGAELVYSDPYFNVGYLCDMESVTSS